MLRMPDIIATPPPRRGWLLLTAAGCGWIVLAMIAVALVLADKPHFGWLVGTWFLPVMTSGVLLGAILLLVGTWNLPDRRGWRSITLFVWGLVALSSPAFGLMFLLPLGALLLSLPLIVSILVTHFRRARIASGPALPAAA
jgi:hypothetical protein